MVPSRFTAGEVERQFGVPPERIAICPPGAPDWTPRAVVAADGYMLFFGTLEPRKNIGGLLDAYERLLVRRPAATATSAGSKRPVPELILAGRATPEAGPWLERLSRRR